jgi:hypothetical protein
MEDTRAASIHPRIVGAVPPLVRDQDLFARRITTPAAEALAKVSPGRKGTDT